jgi:hypothetical protein
MRVVALTPSVGIDDLDDFAQAFEHAQMKLAATLLRLGGVEGCAKLTK